MCYHKSQTASYEKLAAYYSVHYSQELAGIYKPRFHENGFDYLETPVLSSGKATELQMFNWGLIPYWVKDLSSALRIRSSTLNCISEEMFDKPSFRDSAKEGKRCLIPCTGFYEWRWMDEKGKSKIPYFVSLKDQPLFSLAGLYSKWKDNTNGQSIYSYTILTTRANELMQQIHNSKMRMPVILPREFEKDWLNQNLSQEDVNAFCQPYDTSKMKAHTISKLITTKGADTNIEEVMKLHEYEKVSTK